jgi:hypothetical protein
MDIARTRCSATHPASPATSERPRGAADLVFAPHIGALRASFLFAQNPNDLLFREPLGFQAIQSAMEAA